MRIDLETADELLAHSLQAAADAQIFIGAAAVADYRVDAPAEEKIKKTDTNMSLALSRNPDVIAAVRERQPSLFVVGFAAETEKPDDPARAKLQPNKLAMIAANCVGRGRAVSPDQPDFS